MKKLLLLLLLSFLSTQSLAKVGDYYNCEMKEHLVINVGSKFDGHLDTFIFEKKKDKIIFRNFFYASSLPIIVNEYDEEFGGVRGVENFYYKEMDAIRSYGDFSYTAGMGNGAFIVLAKCKKFIR